MTVIKMGGARTISIIDSGVRSHLPRSGNLMRRNCLCHLKSRITLNGEVHADRLGALSEPVPPSSLIEPMSPGSLALADIINKAAIVDPDSPRGAGILNNAV